MKRFRLLVIALVAVYCSAPVAAEASGVAIKTRAAAVPHHSDTKQRCRHKYCR